MKIKRDFITNSSSTSFLLAFKDEYPNKNILAKKILTVSGVDENSVLSDIFEDFFNSIDLEPLNIYELDSYSLEIYKDKIEELKNKGMKIYTGKFSSDNGLIESFFCQDTFLIEDEEIYFDGSVSVW